MANRTTTKPVGLIEDLKKYVHGIPYIVTFIIFQNNVVDFSYCMLLGRPWLRMLKWHMIGEITLLPYRGMG
jgi:hypothetical protein